MHFTDAHSSCPPPLGRVPTPLPEQPQPWPSSTQVGERRLFAILRNQLLLSLCLDDRNLKTMQPPRILFDEPGCDSLYRPAPIAIDSSTNICGFYVYSTIFGTVNFGRFCLAWSRFLPTATEGQDTGQGGEGGTARRARFGFTVVAAECSCAWYSRIWYCAGRFLGVFGVCYADGVSVRCDRHLQQDGQGAQIQVQGGVPAR